MLSLFPLLERKIIKYMIGKHNDIPDDQFPADQLKMGIKIEREHTDVPEIAKQIAKDHLSECSNYYTRLEQMEQECEES